MKKYIILFFFLCSHFCMKAQFSYGTTGLLNMPTADMQKDKTVLLGGSFLEKHATPTRWFYNTYNYYINITFFPWLEVAYDCTLHKAVEHDPFLAGGYWVPSTYGKFINQDRNFAVRLRLWKEGWWKSWTPQIVVGGNDVIIDSSQGGNFNMPTGGPNAFYSRYYIAATKHIKYNGRWGIHWAYLYNKRKDNKYNGHAIGFDYKFDLPNTSLINKSLNKLNLMAEYDSKTINVGANYAIWKDYINFIYQLNKCKYLSFGFYLKIHLK